MTATAGLVLGHAVLGKVPTNTAQVIKPVGLEKGGTIGLITPASAVSRAAFEKAIRNIESLGFEVKYSSNMRVRKGFLAGTDAQRLSDLHQMFEDPDVDGVVCARGGYGSGRLLPKINYDLIRANPKVFMGFSDITALLFAIHKMTGLVCYHGPVGASEFSDFTREGLENVLIEGKKNWSIERPKAWKEKEGIVFDDFIVNPGIATGELIGGNLSLITSLMSTPYDVSFKDKIVFIEEIGESPYRLDRMLTQLLNSGKLSQAKGIALGVFKGCETQPSDPDYGLSVSLKEVLNDRLGSLNIPVMYGLPIGHINDNATIPIGIKAELNTKKRSLTLLERAIL